MVVERLTYGYRRVTALVNRKLRQDSKPTVTKRVLRSCGACSDASSHTGLPSSRPINAKRVLRIMRRHALTLEPHTGLPSSRTHDGKIIVLASNKRWCSDHLELHARNGEVVRVLFVIDACDREIIAWSAVANAGISGEMVRDLMIAAVERRFGSTKAPHRLEWLSDNGSAYIAKPTSETAAALGLTLLFTPVPFARKQRYVGELRQDAETRLRPGDDPA